MNYKFLDKIFSGSAKKQLLTIVCASIGVIIVLLVFACLRIIPGDCFNIVGMFIGNGELAKRPHSLCEWFTLLSVSLIGFILFSVLLSSSITAWITNLKGDIKEGRRRYKLSNHTIIFGSGNQLGSLLDALAANNKEVLVVSRTRPAVKQDNFTYYCGERDDESIIDATFPYLASEIFIIGEDNEPGHDSRSLKCLELLNERTKGTTGKPIHCIITFDDEETTEVYQYLKGEAGNLSSRLYLVDAINEYEYHAEQLILHTEFLPILRKESPKRAHFILYGVGKVTQAMAYTLAHACHYPKLNGKIRKTCITIIAPDVLQIKDKLLLSRPHLFEESVYETVTKDGRVDIHTPSRDILDIEWRFVEGTMADKSVSSLMKKWTEDESLCNCLAVCNNKSTEAVPNILHLPTFAYGKMKLAIYLEDSAELIANSSKTMMFGGNISIFGPASKMLEDPLLKHRSECGQRVNFIYELANSAGGQVTDSPITAWYHRCEADKLSSIYCALGLPLREKTFDMENDITEVYEAEHRRWMMSEYLMGFKYGAERDKSKFIHCDLVSYEDLPEDEQRKDKDLIDNRHYILSGKGEITISRNHDNDNNS